jgi:hypothetical protein
MDSVSFDENNWYRLLAEILQNKLVHDDDEGAPLRVVFCDPMDAKDQFLLHADRIADTVMHMHRTASGDFVTFQPAIPEAVTAYNTEAPTKTRPLNNDRDMKALAEAIAYQAPREFLKWQGTVLLESQKIAQWRGESTAFLSSLQDEPYCPFTTVGDDGSVKAIVGRVTVKAVSDKLTLTFNGPATEYLDVIRDALRSEHRHHMAIRSERDGDDVDAEGQVRMF